LLKPPPKLTFKESASSPRGETDIRSDPGNPSLRDSAEPTVVVKIVRGSPAHSAA
jgi:hypothetical protein